MSDRDPNFASRFPYRAFFYLTIIFYILAELAVPLLAPGHAVLHSFIIRALLNDIYTTGACLGTFFIYAIVLRPEPRQLLVITLLGIIGEYVFWELRLANDPSISLERLFLHLGVGLGLSAWGAMLYTLWRDPQERPLLLPTLTLASLLPSWQILAYFAPNGILTVEEAHQIKVPTLDCALYYADGLLGFQPSIWIGRLVLGWYPVKFLFNAIYSLIAFFMAMAAMRAFLYPNRNIAPPLLVFLAILLVGAPLTNIWTPALGIKVFLGNLYPFGVPPSVEDPAFNIIAPQTENLCTIPSLHASWLLACYWSLAAHKDWWRPAMGVIFIATLISTLSIGGHYLIDLMVAVPFTLGCYALCVPWKSPWRLPQVGSLLFGWGSTAFYLCLLKYSPASLIGHGAALWSSLILTVALSWWLKLYLDRSYLQNSLPEPAAPSEEEVPETKLETPGAL